MSTHPEDTNSFSHQSSTATPAPGQKKPEHPLTEIIRFALIALIIVVPIRTFVAQPYIVSGASMDETFHDGQYIIVDQLSYYFDKPERGDVVVFRYPYDQTKHFIKRIIAVPGDSITIDGNTITLFTPENPEGFVLDEPYVKDMSPNTFIEETLSDREYFVMGDNRDQSSDSRIWGVLQEENITGRALLRLFPLSEIGAFPGKYEIAGADNSEEQND